MGIASGVGVSRGWLLFVVWTPALQDEVSMRLAAFLEAVFWISALLMLARGPHGNSTRRSTQDAEPWIGSPDSRFSKSQEVPPSDV